MPVKVNLTSLDLKEEKVRELKKILPEIFTENKIDWEKLKQALGENIEKGVEKFGFMWNGKANAVNSVLMPSKLTLKPVKQDGIRFDESENLIIEGDNLEVLKLLQKAYFQRVKMIYIDPPYNTGGDFVYKDDFKAPLQGYLKQTGQTGENGDSMTTNKETNGRFHSSWLSMMYPRLKLAWNLLKDDGVIFVSIDDNEAHRLRIMMDEIFGEDNFVCQLIWQKKTGASDAKQIATITEYILTYTKDQLINSDEIFSRNLKSFDINRYRLEDEYVRQRGKHYIDNLDRGGLQYSNSLNYPIKCPDGTLTYPNGRREFVNDGWIWKWSKTKVEWAIKNGFLDFRKSSSKKSGWSVCYKNYLLVDNENKPINRSAPNKNLINDVLNADSSADIKKIFGTLIFKYSKPVELITKLINYVKFNNDDIVLDFFAGSGTTAQAILELNKKDNGSRKFILVQLPEQTPKDSEAYKAGYKTIADICKERVRRVIKGYGNKPEPLQDGFKVFKLDKSNYVENNFEFDPEKTEEENQANFITYLQKAKQTSLFESGDPIDIVYENIVKEGLSLNSKVAKTSIDSNEVYKVEDNESGLKFYISLDKQISKETIKELLTEQYKDNTFISLDSALNDSDKANLGLHLTLKTI